MVVVEGDSKGDGMPWRAFWGDGTGDDFADLPLGADWREGDLV